MASNRREGEKKRGDAETLRRAPGSHEGAEKGMLSSQQESQVTSRAPVISVSNSGQKGTEKLGGLLKDAPSSQESADQPACQTTTRVRVARN